MASTTKTKPTSSSTPISSQNHFGSLLFCSRCGDLLALPGSDEEIVSYENQTITTRSHPAAFPSSLRQKKTSLVKHTGDVEKKKVYVDEMCEKCGNERMSVKTMQLRSADEGATVFYSCERCGHQTRLIN
ncbi:BZ3500_MvSof-1268-A1-R1_Chr1-1g01104 [Microbotryum saponariae]|uniref:DNA-directed RNA polymerase I subunit RPA12 n=1 Tax=Microbotryum saponariae TaxID=289078 RepID=A0A2X0KIZ2_9BASI|nr:BZ3500_MvSof-1268-A1-R1_Chr1-1g01104 [Microbotryum saponariae]SCZ93389.1 BZ3501_MvSof-1269-A2-R1_Chr1-1g00701 [Microbotryum saponariae]